MKKTFATILIALLSLTGLRALDFSGYQKLFLEEKFPEAEKLLLDMIPGVSSNADKAEIYWRLSMTMVVQGQLETTKDGKKKIFGKGIDYGKKAIEADPKNPECYMWHCANVGRNTQTKMLLSQAADVPVMMKDLTMVLCDLGQVSNSAAWQALSEIYYNHPMKSTDAAINFSRRSCITVPEDELRIFTYEALAKMLWERDLSAEKRAALINDGAAKLKGADDNIEKYAYYDAMTKVCSKWSTAAYGSISDKDEARAVLRYALSRYDAASSRTKTDDAEAARVRSLLSSWK